MKVRKTVIKRAALIYAANYVAATLETGCDSDLITDDERVYLSDCFQRIAERILPQYPNAGELDHCIELALTRRLNK